MIESHTLVRRESVLSPEGEKRTHLTPARSHILAGHAIDQKMLLPGSTLPDTENIAQRLKDRKEQGKQLDFSPLAGLTGESRTQHYETDEKKDFDQQREEWIQNTQRWIDWAVKNRSGFKEVMIELGISEENLSHAADIFYGSFLDNVGENDIESLTATQSQENLQDGLKYFSGVLLEICTPEGETAVDMQQLTYTLDVLGPMLASFGIHLEAGKRVEDYIIDAALLTQSDLDPIAEEIRTQWEVQQFVTKSSLEALARHAGVTVQRESTVQPSPEPTPPASEPPAVVESADKPLREISVGMRLVQSSSGDVYIVDSVIEKDGKRYIYMRGPRDVKPSSGGLEEHFLAMLNTPDGAWSLAPSEPSESSPASGLTELTRANLDTVLAPDSYSPENLINFLKSKFASEYAADSGVWEGYTLEQHTLMALQQYEKYFAGKSQFPSPMTESLFRVMLALHDIGKPEAVREGDRNRQHEFTRRIMDEILTELGYSDADKNLAIAIVDNNFLGEIVQNRTDFSATVDGIKQKAETLGIPPQDFFDILRIYYAVDSSSYTKDAGGLESLDENFVFNPGAGELKFVSQIDDLFNRMRIALVDSDVSRENVIISPSLTEAEFQFALDYLSYRDVFPDVDERERQTFFEHDPLARHYVRELQKIFRKYGEDTVIERADGQVKRLTDTLTMLGWSTENSKGASRTWYLWGAAKQRYLARHPRIKNTLPDADQYDNFDPFSPDNAEEVTRIQDEMFHTMLGRSVYDLQNSPSPELNQVVSSMSVEDRSKFLSLLRGIQPSSDGTPFIRDDRSRLENLLHGDEKNQLSSYQLRKIGELVSKYITRE